MGTREHEIRNMNVKFGTLEHDSCLKLEHGNTREFGTGNLHPSPLEALVCNVVVVIIVLSLFYRYVIFSQRNLDQHPKQNWE